MSVSEKKVIKINSLTQKTDHFSHGIPQRGIIFNDILNIPICKGTTIEIIPF